MNSIRSHVLLLTLFTLLTVSGAINEISTEPIAVNQKYKNAADELSQQRLLSQLLDVTSTGTFNETSIYNSLITESTRTQLNQMNNTSTMADSTSSTSAMNPDSQITLAQRYNITSSYHPKTSSYSGSSSSTHISTFSRSDDGFKMNVRDSSASGLILFVLLFIF
ncbi:hypothetical protein TPHA_0G02160 [Tetrapisispora phaffii CBS 4417]|uniref:Uncharacterized protein n=1 Tax=Tetrapisispora phaffii (strain ATCC 24235 / CBS 4417 / NBRC 1672 / NRRL Y-8282 / UCD 70-5) TaxID=1071381 RepID=G8BVX4_TETPH|nr:hypothetical protein TPHA_0G02160 [Tetrapisispora phaffii CBS 4417]CCE64052.1 hypothetical protein TPHA_0G02160 [Tetrapisispora phaffii CBS 4417]